MVVTDVKGICDSWASLYRDLFTACPVHLGVQSDLLGCLSLSLSVDDAASCDGPISPNEAHAALLGKAKGKSPVSDGLLMEFYVAFWDLLGGDLNNVFNASLDADLLPFSQREALIALIFRKGGRLDHKDWRPISLLNVDYKLCARVLAGRLLKVIATVVSPDQTCGVPGRYIGENVTFLRDVVELANEYNLPVALLSLDQEKAFDRVDWPFLFATLAKMGFGDNFIRWVRLLYPDVRSSVLVNGYTSRPFKPSRGVRQGCPLSPLLYVFSMEVLAANVRCHPDILVCASLVFLLPSLYCPCMLMIRPPFRALIAPLERSSRFMAVSNKAMVPRLWLRNAPPVKVIGNPISDGIVSKNELTLLPVLEAYKEG